MAAPVEVGEGGIDIRATPWRYALRYGWAMGNRRSSSTKHGLNERMVLSVRAGQPNRACSYSRGTRSERIRRYAL